MTRIAEKLGEVAGAAGRFTSFGAEKHGYRLNPPLPESSVATFEAEHGVILPEGYRRFIVDSAMGARGRATGC